MPTRRLTQNNRQSIENRESNKLAVEMVSRAQFFRRDLARIAPVWAAILSLQSSVVWPIQFEYLKISFSHIRRKTMKFTDAEIEKALRLKRLGLPWTPSVGHYVWDETDLIKCESPFHDMVFYILDLKHFFRRADSLEQLQRDLCWLPTWFDARQILAQMGVNTKISLAN